MEPECHDRQIKAPEQPVTTTGVRIVAAAENGTPGSVQVSQKADAERQLHPAPGCREGTVILCRRRHLPRYPYGHWRTKVNGNATNRRLSDRGTELYRLDQ